MTIIPFEPALHYDMIKGFFDQRKFPAPPLEFLPPTGSIVYEGDQPVCAGFLVKTDAKSAIVGHMVSNPEVLGKYRNDGLNRLISHLSLLAELTGYRMVNCATNLPGLQERFKDLGFTQTDENVCHFGRIFECH